MAYSILMKNHNYSIHQTDWKQSKHALSIIRRTVFIDEQRVPESLEWDQFDELSIHLLAIDIHTQAIGCARLLPDGHIGRMAVLPSWRGHGVGSALLHAATQLAQQQGHHKVQLDAQVHAIPFYQRAGFTPFGDEFMDAGIPHRHMQLIFNPS